MRQPADEIDAELWALTTDAGQALLAEVSAVAAPGPAELMRWRAKADAGRVHAALRVVEGRRRGASKFTRAARMWLDPVGAEQATSEIVARHKAARFAGRSVVVDLCAGTGGDALAIAAVGANVLAVDRDPGMNRRIVWNANVYEFPDRVLAVRASAESFVRPSGAWVHIDPDRRAEGGKRAKDLATYVPGLAFLDALIAAAPGGAIKLGPASDFDLQFGAADVEIELISLGGECKEATLWFGASAACCRRATSLPSGANWTDRDGDSTTRVPVDPSGGWIYDPDPALIRAGLLNSFAAAHGLARFAPGVDYLCGSEYQDSPFLAAFSVEAVLPLDLKRLRRELTMRGVGPLEIKTRGVSLRPEDVRARLRLTGGRPATLLLAGGSESPRAVIATRASSHRST